MKHANDPGTIEMFDAPKRRGRPPQGKQALTPAERARRYRRKRVDRFGDVLERPEEATVQAICMALADLSRHAKDDPASILGYKLVAELSRRFPDPFASLASKRKK
ncbi:hypothetical protein RDV84_19270 [Lysobacter yananisis]|uniref:Uncharacterized protein n=1 Tax=Lysobacter yananisis TaxID=1003114 RepID=A0ABY9P515_9GAMM|nr:hypothetical protein [Lysobacter yananisis]WMT02084.1 hypothetical protein RDV84_19270 [Lysobacter yananisis]